MNKQSVKILTTILGAGLGVVYWNFWGCTSGCMLTSVWWRMAIYGSIVGYLLGGVIGDVLSTPHDPS